MEALERFRTGMLDSAAEPGTSRLNQPAQSKNNQVPSLLSSADNRADADIGNLHEYQVRFTDHECAFVDGETFLADSLAGAATRAEKIRTEIGAASFVITSKGTRTGENGDDPCQSRSRRSLDEANAAAIGANKSQSEQCGTVPKYP
jgi:hypothetical protein